jgi:peroxiredoxin
LQAVVQQLEEHGATLVAITPQLVEHHGSMIEKNELAFDLLSDPGNAYADALGLRFEVPENLREIYLSFGIDLSKHNGESSGTLPMPGRIVVDSDGIVRAVDVDPDYTKRPEPDKTVADAAALD